MNNAKIWLVVSPTVGVPVFLGAVAVSAFAVHVAVLSATPWLSDYLSGSASAPAATASVVLPEANTAKASYLPQGAQEVLVTMPDGSQTRAILQMPETLAALR
ncbi:MAG: light-harvesting protein [Rhodobacteraceae bacterium]|nr:light-harvesting protein [Paracoccaceae bacterium]